MKWVVWRVSWSQIRTELKVMFPAARLGKMKPCRVLSEVSSARCPQREGAAECPAVPPPSHPPWRGVSQGKPRLVQDFLYQAKVSFIETAPKGEEWPNLWFSLRAAACCSLLHWECSQPWTPLHLGSGVSPWEDGIAREEFQLEADPSEKGYWFDSAGNNPFAPHTALEQRTGE